MRLIAKYSLSIIALLMVVFTTGCDPDTGTGGVTLPPVIILNSSAELISGDTELMLGTTSFIVSITGNDGDALLRSLTIEENGLVLPADQLNFRTGQTANNPILIAGDDVNGFTYEVEIFSRIAVPGPTTYNFLLTDADGESDAVSFVIDYTQTAPTVELLIGDGFVSGDATVNSFGGVFDVRVQSTAVGDDLLSLSVLENGVLMDSSQLTFNGGAFASMNPIPFAAGEMSGAPIYRIQIAPANTMNDTRAYTFVATDVNGVAGEVSVNVTFDTPPTTPITFDTTGIFFNASGIQLGGLDLDNGRTVSFNSDQAEIQDEGINVNASGENWRRQISGANDAVVRSVDLSDLSDGLTFNGVNTQEAILQAFEAGAALDGDDDFPDTVGDDSDMELVSQPLLGADANSEGEVFAVFANNRYYLVRIDGVNFVANSNNDNYTVSIKY